MLKFPLYTVLKPLKNDFSSEHRRIKAFEATGCFIKSRDFVIGDKLTNVVVGDRIVQDRAEVTAQFVPVRDVLKQFFQLDGVLSNTLKYMKYLQLEKEAGIISNFVQGEIWSEKIKKFENKLVFPLFIYFDDFEVNNPLGGHAGNGKLGGVYYSIPCLPPEYRSAVDNIFLAILFHSADRKSVFEGNEAIFRILVEEINYLQSEGIEITVDGEVKKIYFAMSILTGDNEGLNNVMGFMGGFNANYFCRLCTIIKEDSRKNEPFLESMMRTEENYNSGGFLDPQSTGVQEASVWNEIDFFHVVENFFVDIMHDLLEGVCRYDLGHLLYYFIVEEEMFLVDDLNARLKTFDYAKNGFTNEPPLLTLEHIKSRKLNWSASEMFTFIMMFPMLVEDLIDIDCTNEMWLFFITLKEIFVLCFSKKITLEMCDVLDSKIDLHHELYIKLFEDTLKPKHHNMRHYTFVIRKSKPLSHLAVMRFESKHKDLKAIATSTSSRVNIPYTMAFKEQLRLCWRFMFGSGMKIKLDFGSAGEALSSEDFNRQFGHFLADESTFSPPCLSVEWVNFSGIRYKLGSFPAGDVKPDNFIEFGKISAVFVNEIGDVCFLMEMFSSDCFEDDLHAYEICKTEKMLCVLLEDLLSPFLVIHHQVESGKEFISLKYDL